MALDANFMNRTLIDHARSGVIVWAVSTFCLFYLFRTEVSALTLRTLIWFVAGFFGSGLGLGVLSWVVSEIVAYFAGAAVRLAARLASLEEEAVGKLLAASSMVSFLLFAFLGFLLVKKAFRWFLIPG